MHLIVRDLAFNDSVISYFGFVNKTATDQHKTALEFHMQSGNIFKKKNIEIFFPEQNCTAL